MKGGFPMASNALYISIYQELLHDIQSGKYIENEPLPSEESLCRSYNVSRTTVHKALDMLKDADVVYSVQGNGEYRSWFSLPLLFYTLLYYIDHFLAIFEPFFPLLTQLFVFLEFPQLISRQT